MFELLKFSSRDALAEAAAKALLDELHPSKATALPFCVALSGGRIAGRLFSALAGAPDAYRLATANVHYFWADERCVPPDAPESNFRVAQALLFAPAGVPVSQVHRIKGEDPPDIAAAEAEAQLRRIAPDSAGQPVLDLVILGMGEDGHVASLFPGEPQQLLSSPAVFRPVIAPKPPPNRISISYAVITAASQVWVLASGPGKERALGDALSPGGRSPLAQVLRGRSTARVFTDIDPGQVS